MTLPLISAFCPLPSNQGIRGSSSKLTEALDSLCTKSLSSGPGTVLQTSELTAVIALFDRASTPGRRYDEKGGSGRGRQSGAKTWGQRGREL